MPELMIVDLSHHNTVLDFADAAAAGLIGVIHKATEGTSYVDPTYHERMDRARVEGLAWASYHYLHHGSIDAQMAHYMGTALVAPYSRVCLDYEDAAMSLEDLRHAIGWLQSYDSTLQIAVYGGALLKEQLGSAYDPVLAQCALWLSQWGTSKPTWPKETWPVWSLWQYTDKAGCEGFQPPIDGNTFNGSRENCLAWMMPATPEPAPGIESVTVDIVAPIGVPVLVRVNGIDR